MGFKVFILCVTAIAFLATIPLGSAGFLASQLVAVACVIVGAFGVVLPPRNGNDHPSDLLRWAMGAVPVAADPLAGGLDGMDMAGRCGLVRAGRSRCGAPVDRG